MMTSFNNLPREKCLQIGYEYDEKGKAIKEKPIFACCSNQSD